MIKIHIPYLLSLFILLGLYSCTYDYFEDETNYVVYIPNADATSVSDNHDIKDIHILIYKDNLERQKKSLYPFEDNVRTRHGNFNFKLYPGIHSVYCMGNTYIFDFFNLNSYEAGGFGLKSNSTAEYKYPDNVTDFRIENLKPAVFPGLLVVDTAYLKKKYIGKICLAFKNIKINGRLLDFNAISKIDIEATDVGVYQKLSALSDSISTRSSRYSSKDKVFLSAIPFKNPIEGFDYGVENYYFPSLEESDYKPINLKLEFKDHSGNTLYLLNVEVNDILHMNQVLYLGVDGDRIYSLKIDRPEDWNTSIVSEDDTTPGGGGIGI